MFLKEYQRAGVRFLYEKYKDGKGGILGDDMGLGKTIQVIGFVSHAPAPSPDSPVLIAAARGDHEKV
jgi:SNF2 family DNA or RNA helicase